MNWSAYNASLKNRYDMTVWITEDIESVWMEQDRPKIWGQAPKYSDKAIEICLKIGYLFDIPLRGTQGLVTSFFKMQEIDLPVPDYSRLSRRGRTLDIDLGYRPPVGKKIDVVIDSSGLKVYGEGEWKVRKHGNEKRRTWRKIHLSSDPDTMEIVGCELTGNRVADGRVLPKLVPEYVKKAIADGAYDWKGLYKFCERNGTTLLVPPRRTARACVDEDDVTKLSTRDKYIIDIEQSSLEEWKEESGYHRRSLSETQFYRWKHCISETLRARNFNNQKTEARIKASILNTMAQLGIPRTA